MFAGAFRGRGDGLQRLAVAGFGWFGGEKQHRMALNNGQDVIKIMGDSGRQLADSFHLLGLAELVFQGYLLGAVLRNGQEEWFAIQLEQFYRHQNIPLLAGLVPEPPREIADGHLLVKALEDGAGFRGIGPQVQLLSGASDELGAIETCQILKALVGVQKFFLLERLDRQRNRAGFEGLGKAFFGEAQRCFHLHPLRDFPLELLVGGLKFGRAPADGLVEVVNTVLYLMTEEPLFR